MSNKLVCGSVSNPWKSALAALLFCLPAVGSAHAGILVNTLDSPSPAQINKSSGASASFDAMSFDLVGATAVVESASLSLKSNTSPGNWWIAGIFSSHLTNKAPTTFVADLGTLVTTNMDIAKTTFTPSSPISLAANLRYWVVYGSITSGQQGAYQQVAVATNSAGVSAVRVFESSVISTSMVGRWRSPLQNTLVTTLSGITLAGGSPSVAAAPIFELVGNVGALATAADVTPSNGPCAGGNVVLVTNAVPAIGNGSDITNIVLGGAGTANITGQGVNWVAFVAPAAGTTGAVDVLIQSTSVGDTTLAGAYTVNAQGIIPDAKGLPAQVVLTNTWLNGTNGITLAGSDVGGALGAAVCSAGDMNGDGYDDVLVGQPQATMLGHSGAGMACVALGRSNELPALIEALVTNTWLDGTNGFIMAGAGVSDRCGWFLGGAGDVNGDGYDDTLVSSILADPDGRSDAGEVYLVYGRSNDFPSLAVMTNTWLDGTNGVIFAGARTLDRIGYGMDSAGDMNGDGLSDFLISAAFASPGGLHQAGEVYLVYGRSNGFPARVTMTNTWLDGTNGVLLSGAAASGNCGYSVSAAGDVNGDGYPDLLISAANASPGGLQSAGETYLVYGRSNGLPAHITLTNTWLDGTNGVIFAGAASASWSGYSVDSAGDVNGDGYADLLIGAPAVSMMDRVNAGETYLVYGRSNGFPALVTLTNTWLDGMNGVIFAGASNNYNCGQAVASAGDVNGDGFSDLLIGAYMADPDGRENAGEAYLVYGRSRSLPAYITMEKKWLDGENGVLFSGAVTGDCSGVAVSSAGDVDADGFADLLIGAFTADPWGKSAAGEAYLVYGRVLYRPIRPTSGSWTGGYQVVIEGLNLGDGVDITNVTLCGVSAASIVSQSATQVVVVAGVGTPGLGDARVFSTSFGETVKSNAYTYLCAGIAVAGPDFALTAVGRAVTNLFTVSNSGDEALLITAATNDGPGAAYFDMSAIPGVVEPGTASNFPVVFTPDVVGVFTPTCFALNNSLTSNYSFALSGKSYALSASSGPYGGGNTLTITNGHFGTITNVTVGGVVATIQDSGDDWARITVPATGSAGIKDIVIQTSDNGDTTLAVAYTVNPEGQIGWTTDASAWTNLSSGMDSGVGALTWDGSNLYAGGSFTTAGGESANYVAKWDAAAGVWTSLGSGMDSGVGALAWDGSNLYAGGSFTTAGGEAANYVAKWDAGGGVWTSLGSGMDNQVNALAWDGSNLYAGGSFTTAGGEAANYVAKWDAAAGVWSNLGDGMDADVVALAWSGSNLYAAGWFTTAGGVSANYVAKWDPATAGWINLDDGMDWPVSALAWDGTNLYAGGGFTTAGGEPANYVAKWDEASGVWTNLGGGTDGDVNALAHDGTNLFAGGLFTTAGGVPANYVAEWDATAGAWTNLGSGMDNGVSALSHDGQNLYAGGWFTTAGGVTANYVAEWVSHIIDYSGVEPSSGSAAGGFQVSISGSHLGDGMDITNVTLCGVSVASIVSQSATQVVVTAGVALAAGPGDVRVYSTSYGETVKSSAFEYLREQQAPLVFTPSSPQAYGTTNALTVSGGSGTGAVSYAVLGGPGSIVGGTNLTITAASGTVEIRATKAQDDLYFAASVTGTVVAMAGNAEVTIESAHGSTIPVTGVYTMLVGSVFTNQAQSPDTQGTTQYVCAGWAATENLDPAGGSGTQAIVTVNGAGTLTWLWTTNYRLTTAVSGPGSVLPATGWQSLGSNVEITATADPYYHFTTWTDDAMGDTNPLVLLMDAPKWVTANFLENMTTNKPTPEWWLAEYGLTNFEADVLLDADGDGVPTGDEYVMNTDPTNGLLFLYAAQFGMAYGTNCWDVVSTNSEPPYDIFTNTICEVVGQLIGWPCATDRVYDVEYGLASLGGVWQPLEGFTDIEPQNTWIVITNTIDSSVWKFYRLQVRRPGK